MEISMMAIIGNIAGTIEGVSPLLVWSAIVVALAVLITVCAGAEICRRMRRSRATANDTQQTARSRRQRRLTIRMGSEREEMFVPGDPFPWKH